MRTLVAGFGNVLRGDDGFGVEVVRRLGEGPIPEGVELMDVGTGGVRLAQELMGGYDRLIIVDAMNDGDVPGTLYVRAVEGITDATEIDMHLAVPSRALTLAKALKSLPPEVYLIGCEPLDVEELTMELSPPVGAAVETAVARVRELLAAEAPGGGSDADPTQESGAADAQEPGAFIKRQDEILELLYWLEGEGMAAGSATLSGLVRFLAQPEAEVVGALGQLMDREDVSLRDNGEYRLTEEGRREAARRFAAEFAPMLSQGHGECSDPDCDCHTSPNGAADCLANRAHGGH